MTLEPSSTPERDADHQPEGPASAAARPVQGAGIRRQVSDIIAAVLSDPSPDQAQVRDQLRKHLADHPDNPERALVDHLTELQARAWLSRDAGDADAGHPSTRPGSPRPAGTSTGEGPDARSRIEAVLQGRLLVTAFQPIQDLSTGAVVGAGALTRFVTDGHSADHWFAEAAHASLGGDLEFAAMESALAAAENLPAHLYVTLKLSPPTCLDPLLPDLVLQSGLSPSRVVLELTDPPTAEQADALLGPLIPLRNQGVRLAVGHSGSYPGSVRHINLLRPDIIKLDRNLIEGISTNALRHTVCESLIWIADQIGALIIAEGIETGAELATLRALGIRTGQGYFLGRPTTLPEDWGVWEGQTGKITSLGNPDGGSRS